MEKNNGYKFISILALLIATAGMTLSYASFSNTLVTKIPTSLQEESSTIKIVFSSSPSSLAIGSIRGVATSDATAGVAKIINKEIPSISNLTANFTKPGQSVTYTFYVHNSGTQEAYLKNIYYSNVSGENSSRVCTTVDSKKTSKELISAACENISLKVEIAEINTLGTLTSITGHTLPMGDYETVKITIDYPEDSNQTQGEFKVEFGDISLLYEKADYN